MSSNKKTVGQTTGQVENAGSLQIRDDPSSPSVEIATLELKKITLKKFADKQTSITARGNSNKNMPSNIFQNKEIKRKRMD
jgi:hypothetical protein